MDPMQPDPHDVPGFNRATGVDDPTPRHEYHDEPPQHPPEHIECVTECRKCGEDAPKGQGLCGACEAEQEMERAMDDRIERGL